MHSAEFEWNSIKIIDEVLTNEGHGGDDFSIAMVWSCKTLQNNKGMFAVLRENDNRYFEVTYDGDMQCFYIDCYDKIWNDVVLVRGDKVEV